MNSRLSEILNSSRPPHALLLTGADDKTRKKEAAAAAYAFICESEKGNKPCGKCGACKKAKAGSHPDIITVIPTGKSGNYKKEDLKTAVSENLYVAPNEAQRKVYIIHDANKLSAVLQNNLLKSIEEPPEFAGFIFTSPSREFMLDTVISRVTEVRLGEAESEFRQASSDKTQLVTEIAAALASKDEYKILKACSGIKKNRQYIAEICSLFILVLRDALAGISGAPGLTGEDKTADILSVRCSESELFGAITAAKKIMRASESNANENLMLTGLSTELAKAVCPYKARKES